MTMVAPITFTLSSSTSPLVSSNLAEAVEPRIYLEARTDLSQSSSARPQEINENKILASMSLRERLRYLAVNNKPEFITSLLAVLGGIYMLFSAIEHFSSVLGNWFSMAANAQTSGSLPKSGVSYSSSEMLQWYIAGLMGISLLCSWGMTMMATHESKIAFGKDTIKMILGFVVGFLSGNIGGTKVR